MANLDYSKVKDFSNNNFQFDGNGQKFARGVENTVEKGEIAGYEQFLFCSQCFQKTCPANM